MDIVVHVVRCFDNDDVTHVEGSIDQFAILVLLKQELIIKDLDSLDKQINKKQKIVKSGDKQAKFELEVLNKVYSSLNDGVMVKKILL